MAKAGRPKQDIIKDKVVSVRMRPEDYFILKAYANQENMTVTQVMMEGVNKLLAEERH